MLKEKMYSGLLAIATLLVLATSGAKAQAHSWGGCEMKFKVKIHSNLFWQNGSGMGEILCSDVHGRVIGKERVKIDIHGHGFGIGVFEYEGVAGGIDFVDPRQIEGSYYVVDANLAVGVGLGAALDFYNQDNGFTFGGKILGGTGLGVAINGSEWKISIVPRGDRNN